MRRQYGIIAGVCGLLAWTANAMLAPTAPSNVVTEAAVAFEGTVYAQDVFRHPDLGICTETHLEVTRTYKGVLPERVRLQHPGGRLGNRGQVECLTPTFIIGQTYLILAAVRADGSLCALQGRASVMPVPLDNTPAAQVESRPYGIFTTLLREQYPDPRDAGRDVRQQISLRPVPANLSYVGTLVPATNGIPSRFVQPDRGEPLTYIIDMDYLPDDISSNAALTMIDHALSAWEAAASVRFSCTGIQSFGQSARSLANSDNPPADLMIQLHNGYNAITNNSTLGIGGWIWTDDSLGWLLPNGGAGGRIGTNEFYRNYSAYVMMNHEANSLTNASTMEEVLTHELGHALSLGHSSEDDETEKKLKDALMYWRVHADGRGASVRSWDSNAVHTVYPPDDTAPYGYNRLLYALLSEPQPAYASGLNRVAVPKYDRMGDTITITNILSTTNCGNFQIESCGIVFYKSREFYTGKHECDPDESWGYDYCMVRLSDGENLSPPVRVSVIALYENTDPTNNLPDFWEDEYELEESGNADKDRFSDRLEWLMDTDPTNANSGLALAINGTSVTWHANAYEVYELLSADSLTNTFTREGNPITPTNANGRTPISPGSSPSRFYRLRYVP